MSLKSRQKIFAASRQWGQIPKNRLASTRGFPQRFRFATLLVTHLRLARPGTKSDRETAQRGSPDT
jgi:hypothetical protein